MADTPNRIPRNQWAKFVRGEDGEPIYKLIQDLENLQDFTVDALPADVAAAQATADAALAAIVALNATQQYSILPADVAENAGVFADATGLLIALAINSTYIFDALLTFQSAGLGVGIALTFALPAGATINGGYRHFTTLTAENGAYNNAPGAVSGNTVLVPVINSNNPITGRWVIRTGATAGNAQLRFRSSAAATAVTLKQNLSAIASKKIG